MCNPLVAQSPEQVVLVCYEEDTTVSMQPQRTWISESIGCQEDPCSLFDHHRSCLHCAHAVSDLAADSSTALACNSNPDRSILGGSAVYYSLIKLIIKHRNEQTLLSKSTLFYCIRGRPFYWTTSDPHNSAVTSSGNMNNVGTRSRAHEYNFLSCCSFDNRTCPRSRATLGLQVVGHQPALNWAIPPCYDTVTSIIDELRARHKLRKRLGAVDAHNDICCFLRAHIFSWQSYLYCVEPKWIWVSVETSRCSKMRTL